MISFFHYHFFLVYLLFFLSMLFKLINLRQWPEFSFIWSTCVTLKKILLKKFKSIHNTVQATHTLKTNVKKNIYGAAAWVGLDPAQLRLPFLQPCLGWHPAQPLQQQQVYHPQKHKLTLLSFDSKTSRNSEDGQVWR